MANFSYIGFFNRPIDSFAFRGMNYGMETIWPTISSLEAFELRLVVCLITTWLSFWLYRKMGGKIRHGFNGYTFKASWSSLMAIVIPILVLIILGRGSISTFPLSHRHLTVSSETAVNNLVPNGIVALYYGYREFKHSKSMAPASDITGRELFQSFYGRPAEQNDLFPQFFTRTEKSNFLENNPPHVVLNLMEGMANSLLNPGFTGGIDLAGQLRSHLRSDYYFTNFLPAHDDTQKSLVSMLVNTEYGEISYSLHRNTPLETSVARVFKRAGYQTIFVYAGFEGLSNRSQYFKVQGFDEFIGAHQLKALYPMMEESVWGGQDQFVFEEVYRRLISHKSSAPPLFIVTLTITNHPPYQSPDGYGPIVSKIPNHLKARLQDLPKESLNTFLYSNDQLGYFISKVKGSSIKQNTIIAATGDHGIRGMRYDDDERLQEISVPLYIYIPEKYKPIGAPDENQIASHKDIMPTLFNTSLSEANYLNLGRNLLSPTDEEPVHDFAYHANYLIKNGYAYEKTKSDFLPAQEVSDNFSLISDPQTEGKGIGNGQFYSAILDWLTRFQLQKSPHD
jgi:phosphoglycerol transferase MdoB-like AlkP superfamily enzyme